MKMTESLIKNINLTKLQYGLAARPLRLNNKTDNKIIILFIGKTKVMSNPMENLTK